MRDELDVGAWGPSSVETFRLFSTIEVRFLISIFYTIKTFGLRRIKIQFSFLCWKKKKKFLVLIWFALTRIQSF